MFTLFTFFTAGELNGILVSHYYTLSKIHIFTLGIFFTLYKIFTFHIFKFSHFHHFYNFFRFCICYIRKTVFNSKKGMLGRQDENWIQKKNYISIDAHFCHECDCDSLKSTYKLKWMSNTTIHFSNTYNKTSIYWWRQNVSLKFTGKKRRIN